MIASIHSFEESHAAAQHLADMLGVPHQAINARHFPDGESLVEVAETAGTAIVYRSLDHPNEKLIELILAASALRSRGAERIILVAPYLGYMRQDTAFRPGQAVSQKVIGSLLAAHFGGLVTVDPHLHRVASLSQVVPGIETVAVSAAAILADLLKPDIAPDTILIGPDVESRPWVESIAGPLALPALIAEKRRLGDREVELVIDGIECVHGRGVVLVDDLISSGGTLLQCAELLRAAGASRIEAIATHCLAGPLDLAKLADGGISRVRSTDTVAGPTASVAIAPALGAAIAQMAMARDRATGID